MMYRTAVSELIAPAFYTIHNDIKNDLHTHYFIKGGRGSTKSSFVSIEIILGMMRNPGSCAAVFRKFGTDLKTSVFSQLLWAIDVLNVSEYWCANLSPLRLTYIPTGQEILFRGVDDPSKSKSIKLRSGYFKYAWFEEADQFSGMPEIRKITQSILRGGEGQKVFYTYNPPQSVQNWINAECTLYRADRLTHHSTYLDVPVKWLGGIFITEADELKATSEIEYNHEYLGEVTGTGGEVFRNVSLRKITDDEVKGLGRIYRGLDFGFSVDPCAYVCCCLHNYRLYIFHEFYGVEMGYDRIAQSIECENIENDLIYCDSAEPRSIHELTIRGIKATAARKGKGSVDHGIARLSRDIKEIIIDNEKCPNTAREFSRYEYERDKDGNFKSVYPDKNNHSIDAVRYALCNTELFTRPEKTYQKQHYDFEIQKPPSQRIRGASPSSILKKH